MGQAGGTLSLHDVEKYTCYMQPQKGSQGQGRKASYGAVEEFLIISTVQKWYSSGLVPRG